MRPRTQFSILVLVLLGLALPAGPARAGDDAARQTLDDVLKRVDKAMRGHRGAAADLRFAEVLASRPAGGSGTILVDFKGRLRADVAGDNTTTFLSLPPYLHVYRPGEAKVTVYNTERNPDRIAQYAMVGFAPAGSAMKKDYTVRLVGPDDLDGTPALLLELRPKAKARAAAVERVELWLDPRSWLPAQHRIYHATIDVYLELRYLDARFDDELPAMRFVPVWPDGTRQILE